MDSFLVSEPARRRIVLVWQEDPSTSICGRCEQKERRRRRPDWSIWHLPPSDWLKLIFVFLGWCQAQEGSEPPRPGVHPHPAWVDGGHHRGGRKNKYLQKINQKNLGWVNFSRDGRYPFPKELQEDLQQDSEASLQDLCPCLHRAFRQVCTEHTVLSRIIFVTITKCMTIILFKGWER